MVARCSFDTTPSVVLSSVPSIQAVARGYHVVSLRRFSAARSVTCRAAPLIRSHLNTGPTHVLYC